MAKTLQALSLLLLLLAVGHATPVAKAEAEIATQLRDYLDWMNQVSDHFDNEVTSSNLNELEERGQVVHDQLMAAIERSDLTFAVEKSDLSQKILINLEQEITTARMKDEKTDDKILGLVLADSFQSSQGAKIALASQIFDHIGEKLGAQLDAIAEKEIDGEKLEAIFQDVSSAEIAFDSVVSSFRSVEAVSRIQRRQKRSPDNLPTPPPIGRRFRLPSMVPGRLNSNRFGTTGPHGLNLGGGFSTDGSGVRYDRGRITVTAKPHFNFTPRPSFQGGTVGVEHRFRNNRGSLFGSATVNRRGGFQGAHIGVKINFP